MTEPRPKTRLQLSYDAHGGTPAAVVLDARRIAGEAFADLDSIDAIVDVGEIEPESIAHDGGGRTQITRWKATVTVTADATLPDPS